jgi:hypothetical protein
VDTIIALVAGLGLVFFGRRFFWFFVGVGGFLAGWYLALHYLPPDRGTLVLITAVAAGIIGILLALLLQKVAIIVGGFIAGGFALVTLAPSLGPLGAVHPAIPFVIGGVIGALVLRAVFDIGLIALSALAGSALLLEVLHIKDPFRIPLMVVLAVIGAAVQWKFKERGKRKERPKEE